MTPSSLLAPFEQHDLQVAAAAGALLTAAGLMARRIHQPWRVRHPSTSPSVPRAAPTLTAGAVVVAVAAVVLVDTGNAPGGLLVALGVLATGGAGATALRSRRSDPLRQDRRRRDPLRRPPTGMLRAAEVAVPPLLVVPGAALLSFGPGAGVPGPPWVRVVVLVVTPVAAAALWDFDRRWGRLALPLLVVAAAGIYATTPDTEQILIVLGSILGVAAVGWWPALRVGPVAVPALAGLVVWTVAVDGRGRHSAIVGGLACFGILVVEPWAAVLRAPRHAAALAGLQSNRAVTGAAIGAQAGVVAVASRVAGLRTSTAEAVAVVLPLLVLSTAALVAPRSECRSGPGLAVEPGLEDEHPPQGVLPRHPA